MESDFTFGKLRFLISGSDVDVLHTPSEFYETLVNLVKNSKQRIVLASLYIGNGQLENALIDEIEQNLACNSSLKVKILLDYNRSTRTNDNSLALLSKLYLRIGGNEQRVKIHLFHTPLLRHFYKSVLPRRWDEIMGVQHMKFYIFDDNLLISGANLSESYFTTRQDRYVLIKKCHKLANFYEELVEAVGSCSFNVGLEADRSLNAEKLHPLCDEHPFRGNFHTFCSMLKRRIENLVEKWSSDVSGVMSNKETFVYPLVQMGAAGLHDEEREVEKILGPGLFTENCCIKMATGYFNLTQHYQNLIAQGPQNFSILMASPQANGFNNASGISSYVPSIYSNVARQFFERISHSSDSRRVQLVEYGRPNWTFHAKGLWVDFHPSQKKFPFVTFIGSTNYGYRSAYRDLETQVVIATNDENLKWKFRHEQENLWRYASNVDSETFNRTDHWTPHWTKIFTQLVKKFF